MHNTQDRIPALAEYVDMRTLLHDVEHTFPSQDSLKWFVRRHREELVVGGALISIAGRVKFHPLRFQEVAVEVGRAAALTGSRAAA